MSPERSSCSQTVAGSTGCQKLGQPVPESYLVSEENSGAPPHTQRYRPSPLSSQCGPVNARSVPCPGREQGQRSSKPSECTKIGSIPGVADGRSGAATECLGKILKFRPRTTLPCRLCLQKLCIFAVKSVSNPAPSGGGTRSGGNGILRCGGRKGKELQPQSGS